MKRIIRASTSNALTQREKDHALLARQLGAEGIVLLENNGVLPLKDKRVALYGYGARHTCYGGTGSGENRPRYRVNIETGLLDAGIEISSQCWLNDFDAEYDQERTQWLTNLRAELKKIPAMQSMDYASAHPFEVSYTRAITEQDVKESATDTAIYVLTRIAGEGSDRSLTKGDYFIRDAEMEHMRFLSRNYTNLIVLLNVGGIIDLSFVDEIKPAALVYVMQGGMEAGNSVADILTGKENPSGKLTDTWAMRYEDYPNAGFYSSEAPDMYQQDYRERIYVGYRWFDSVGIKSRYPFGYGMSYTDFDVKIVSLTQNGAEVSVKVSVANTGTQYSGKEVVQLYCRVPEGKLDKEAQSLIAFGKTKKLKPGEEEILNLTFRLEDLAVFDYDRSAFVLEQGKYVLKIGSSSVNNDAAAALKIENNDVMIEQVEHICPMNNKIDFFEVKRLSVDVPEVPEYIADTSSIKTITHDYSREPVLEDSKTDEIMERLSIDEKISLIVGTSYFGPVRNTVFGASGYTTSKLHKKHGIENMTFADGPQGLNLVNRSLMPKINFMNIPAMPETLDYGFAAWMGGLSKPKENDKRTVYHQYTTAWPCATLAAQSWNVELARLQGKAIAVEMKEYGVVYWLAPAVNIHRNPLCGRNYEYYSEDPVLSGLFAGHVLGGIAEVPGCYPTLKHFTCNNAETERMKTSSNLDERTLREIYLKPFRIALCYHNRSAVMASYNKVNGVYVTNNYDLLTKVLRCEWNFEGIVMTDWMATGHDEAYDEYACKSGNDLIMPGMGTANAKIKKALQEGRISEENIHKCARRVVYYSLHCY